MEYGDDVKTDQNKRVEDLIQDYVGANGLWQWAFCIFGALSFVPFDVITNYTHFTGEFRCEMDAKVESTFINMSFKDIENIIQPSVNVNDDYPKSCYRKSLNWSELINSVSINSTLTTFEANYTSSELCPNAYITKNPDLYLYSARHEFNMLCDKYYLNDLSITLYMAGMLVGFFVSGFCGDLCGRKYCFMIFSVGQLLSGIFAFNSSTSDAYLATRFFQGFFATLKVIIFTLIIFETSTDKWRTYFVILYNLIFSSCNKLILALEAYFIEKWRLVVFVGTLWCCLSLFLIPILIESPKWLLSKNRRDEAIQELTKLRKYNMFGKKISAKERDKIMSSLGLIEKSQAKPEEVGVGIKFIEFRMIRRTLLASIVFSSQVVGFYGSHLYSSYLNFNVYASGIMNSISGLFGSLLAFTLVSKMKSKKFALMMIYFCSFLVVNSGFFYSILMNPVNDTILAVITALNVLLLEAGFQLIYLYIMEIYPTHLRSKGLGFASGFARIGSLFCSYINELSHTWFHGSPLLIYAILKLIAVISLILMPNEKF